MQINKKGNILTEESVKVILAVAVVALMIWLMIAIFAPSFDKGDEKGESYLEQLKEAIKETDKGGEASFFMIDDGVANLDSYLVYFGKAIRFEPEEISFISSKKSGINIICLCSLNKGTTVCNHCTNLDLPATFTDGITKETNPENWAVREGARLKLEKKGEVYVFNIR